VDDRFDEEVEVYVEHTIHTRQATRRYADQAP
jgi:hypothetical protein